MNSLDSPWYRFHECEDPQYVIQSAFIFRCSFCIQFCYAGCEINKNIVHIKVQAFHHITLCGSYCRNTNIMILQFTCKLPCESYPEIEHSLNMKNVCLISIHTNAAGNGRQWMNARGWCCYTSRGQTAGDRLATCLYEAASLHLPGHKIRKDYSDGDPDWESDFTILKNTLCAAALSENLFHDNADDLAFLESAPGRHTIIDLHVRGIIDYVNG